MRRLLLALSFLLAACGGAEEVDDPEAVIDEDPASAAGKADGLTGWTNIGFGVAYREFTNVTGSRAAVFYGGYTAKLDWTESWAEAMQKARLEAMGVRHLYAVQGPRDASYAAKEIGNSKLAAHLVGRRTTGPILVVGHSSGALVSYELFSQLFVGRSDPQHVTWNRIVFLNLDAGGLGLTSALVSKLKRAYFVGAKDTAIGTRSNNAWAVEQLGTTYAAFGAKTVIIDATGSGCARGGTWCLHDALVNTRPHNPTAYDLARDYVDFAPPRAVQEKWIEAAGADLAR